eukprot:3221259-Heterocapsa_arctica.AAC.1
MATPKELPKATPLMAKPKASPKAARSTTPTPKLPGSILRRTMGALGPQHPLHPRLSNRSE